MINGKFYVAGGSNIYGPQIEASLDRYNPATDTWTTLAPLPAAGAARGAVLQGKLYVVVETSNGRRAYAYDPATNKWTAKAAPRWYHDDIVPITWGGKPFLLAVGGIHLEPDAYQRIRRRCTRRKRLARAQSRLDWRPADTEPTRRSRSHSNGPPSISRPCDRPGSPENTGRRPAVSAPGPRRRRRGSGSPSSVPWRSLLADSPIRRYLLLTSDPRQLKETLARAVDAVTGSLMSQTQASRTREGWRVWREL